MNTYSLAVRIAAATLGWGSLPSQMTSGEEMRIHSAIGVCIALSRAHAADEDYVRIAKNDIADLAASLDVYGVSDVDVKKGVEKSGKAIFAVLSPLGALPVYAAVFADSSGDPLADATVTTAFLMVVLVIQSAFCALSKVFESSLLIAASIVACHSRNARRRVG